MAERLLEGAIGDAVERDSTESTLLKALTVRCGYVYATKCRTMLKDMKESAAGQTDFLEHARNKQIALDVDFSAAVLTDGCWPRPRRNGHFVNLPPKMLACQQAFEAFYRERNPTRKLWWDFSLGSATVVGAFAPNGTKVEYELHTSPLQAAVLLLFNNVDALSLSEMQCALDVSTPDLEKCLLHLCADTHRVLIKESDATYRYNADLSLAEKTVATAPAVDTVARGKERMEKLLHEERFHYLDARIVKTMQVYKRFEHGYLVDKVMALSGKHSERHQPGFSYFFTKEMVEERVQSLLEREYMVRDGTTAYRYNNT